MTAVQKVAIAGSGVAGMAVAIALAKAGVAVTVFEAKPERTTLGSGISLQGNALRALDELGVWDEVQRRGYGFDGLTLRAPGPGAPVVAQLPDVKTGGPDYPAALGMYRPDLNEILHARAAALGIEVTFGAKVTGVREADDGGSVEVEVNGEPAGAFELLIGADGLNSTVRALIGIAARPEPTGMGIWRASVSRPAEVATTELYYGGPVYIAGYTPTGDDSMYAFLVEQAHDRTGVDDATAKQIMLEASAAYDGPWNQIRADLSSSPNVNYTWFTSHLIEGAWNRGRTVVIGDAAHSCPPTIAQGAAQGLEDALVLSELLVAHDAVDEGLWAAFHERRVPRATAVVEASVQLGQWQLEGNREADPAPLIVGVAKQMAQPA